LKAFPPPTEIPAMIRSLPNRTPTVLSPSRSPSPSFSPSEKIVPFHPRLLPHILRGPEPEIPGLFPNPSDTPRKDNLRIHPSHKFLPLFSFLPIYGFPSGYFGRHTLPPFPPFSSQHEACDDVLFSFLVADALYFPHFSPSSMVPLLLVLRFDLGVKFWTSSPATSRIFFLYPDEKFLIFIPSLFSLPLSSLTYFLLVSTLDKINRKHPSGRSLVRRYLDRSFLSF